jgi:hypothetical protein
MFNKIGHRLIVIAGAVALIVLSLVALLQYSIKALFGIRIPVFKVLLFCFSAFFWYKLACVLIYVCS